MTKSEFPREGSLVVNVLTASLVIGMIALGVLAVSDLGKREDPDPPHSHASPLTPGAIAQCSLVRLDNGELFASNPDFVNTRIRVELCILDKQRSDKIRETISLVNHEGVSQVLVKFLAYGNFGEVLKRDSHVLVEGILHPIGRTPDGHVQIVMADCNLVNEVKYDD